MAASPVAVIIQFDKLPELTKALHSGADKVVRESAMNIEARAKELAPVDTGNLRSSITAESTGFAEAAVYTAVDYGLYQEMGTYKMAAQPFMVPAAEEERPRFIGAMKGLLGE